MKRVLVTGGTGFIGANLARRLLRDGHQVHLIVSRRAVPWRLRDVAMHLVRHQADLRDADAVRRAVAEARPDWVFHLAARGGDSARPDLRAVTETNVLGAMNLIEGCLERGFEAFVNADSCAGYDDGFGPKSYFAVSKASATLLCRHTAEATGRHLPTLRLASVYGPYEDPGHFLPGLVANGLSGSGAVPESPRIPCDYVYVEDVVEAFLSAATHPSSEPGPAYDIGTGRTWTAEQVAETARRALSQDGDSEASSAAQPGGEPGADVRKAREESGWQPRFDLEAGLRAFAAWLAERPEMQELYRGAESRRAA